MSNSLFNEDFINGKKIAFMNENIKDKNYVQYRFTSKIQSQTKWVCAVADAVKSRLRRRKLNENKD